MNLEEAKKKSCSCVYKITFPDGKCYVGKTKELSSRIGLYKRFYEGEKNGLVSDAINKYGLDSLDFEILSEVKCKNKFDLELCLSILEIKYIRELNTISPNGYNASIGGEILGVSSDLIYTDLEVNKPSNTNKPILLYDTNGDFVKEYASIGRCAYDLGLDDEEVRKHVNKMVAMRGKYILREKKFNYVPLKICVSEVKIKERVKYKTVIVPKYVEREVNIGRPVKALLYDENGDFRGEFDSKVKALKSYSNAHSIPFGTYYGGYIIYKKVSDDYPQKIEPYVEAVNYILGEEYKPLSECKKIPVDVKEKISNRRYQRKGYGKHTNLINNFKVRQFDDDGFEAIYDNIRDASSCTGISYSCIWACVFGRTKTCAGYYWEKIDE